MAEVMDAAFPTPPTGMTESELLNRFTQLKADADAARLAFMRQRCPAELHPHLEYWIANDPTLDPAQTTVRNGDTIIVTSSGGQQSVGATARVANGVLETAILPGSIALVSNNMPCTITAGVSPGNGFVGVQNGVLDRIVFGPPTDKAVVSNGDNVVVFDAASQEVPGSPGVARVQTSRLQLVTLQA